jgi:hypothetical protein
MKSLIIAGSVLALGLAALPVAAAPLAQDNGSQAGTGAYDPVSIHFIQDGEGGLAGSIRLDPEGPTSTRASVKAMNLVPDERYVSHWYGNHDCALESGSESGVIGRPFTGDSRGLGGTNGSIARGLPDIHAVSIRLASTSQLLVCVDIDP